LKKLLSSTFFAFVTFHVDDASFYRGNDLKNYSKVPVQCTIEGEKRKFTKRERNEKCNAVEEQHDGKKSSNIEIFAHQSRNCSEHPQQK